MQQLSQTGGFIAADVNGTHIKVTNMGGHFHLYVRAGADRVAELSGNHSTARSACRRASYLRNALLVGFTVQQLVDEHLANQAGVLNAAAQVIEQAETGIVEGVTANMQAATDRMNAPRVEGRQAATNDGNGWTAMRQAATRTARTVSDPMGRVIASANSDGYIVRCKDATSTQLIALDARGKVVLDYRWQGKTRRIAGAWLVSARKIGASL